MAWIRELKLRDVRCFEDEQSARLGRRVTLLVGENSAGKSTFMGCYKAFAKLASLDDLAEENHFDKAPFNMGGFDTVVRSGKKGFAVGGTFKEHCHESASFAFRAQGDLPVDRELQLRVASNEGSPQDVRIVVPDEPDVLLRFGGPGFTFDFRPSELSYHSIATWLSRYIRQGHFPWSGDLDLFRKRTGESGSEKGRNFLRLTNFLLKYFPFPDPGSFAVHAQDPALPERARSYAVPPTYLSSECDYFLRHMGEKLRLWRGISFATNAETTHTEIHVDTPNGSRNLVDVGYGIHSLLPLLSAIDRQQPESTILLQQPEVHVHPRAQAALAQWMAESGRRFMIETHSDHLVDRFRICVMRGILTPEDLSIVYFQPSKDGTHSRIHGISVDDQGNLEGAPPEYRSFFLNETRGLLGIG